MAKRKTKSLTYPATMLVKYSEDGDYFAASTDLGELAELGQALQVGVYQLMEIRTLVAPPELLPTDE